MKKLFTLFAGMAIAAAMSQASAVDIYIDNQMGWEAPTLYAWGDQEIFGAWPGAASTGTATVDGRTYLKYECPATADGLTEHLIFNINSSQCKDYTVTLDKDYYFVAAASKLIPADEYTGELPKGHTLYVLDKGNLSPLYVYAWSTGNPELFGAWPGATASGNVTIAGETYKTFEMQAVTADYNLIFNDNSGDGTHQFDGPTINSGADVYVLVEDGKASVLPTPGVTTYNLYIENKTGWDALYVYAWADDEPALFGAWPGAKAEQTEVVDGITYFVIPFEGNGKTYNLIFNNNDTLQYDVPDVALDGNKFFTANPDAATSAVLEVAEDEAPVYFNLQGVRVDNPEKGLYIKVTGSKAQRVIIR